MGVTSVKCPESLFCVQCGMSESPNADDEWNIDNNINQVNKTSVFTQKSTVLDLLRCWLQTAGGGAVRARVCESDTGRWLELTCRLDMCQICGCSFLFSLRDRSWFSAQNQVHLRPSTADLLMIVCVWVMENSVFALGVYFSVLVSSECVYNLISLLFFYVFLCRFDVFWRWLDVISSYIHVFMSVSFEVTTV